MKLIFCIIVLLGIINSENSELVKYNDFIICHYVNPKTQKLVFFLKDDKHNYFNNHGSLLEWLNSRDVELCFAINGGMFNKDFSPKGLYVENGHLLFAIDTISIGYGNFYIQPNGVFYITKSNDFFICKSKEFIPNSNIEYATQSGPMLVIDGKINSVFNLNSRNINIRNGVGIFSDGRIVFAISKKEINFYEFAMFFKNAGCVNALYLDGFISKMYLPEKKIEQLDGRFGVILGEIIKKNKFFNVPR